MIRYFLRSGSWMSIGLLLLLAGNVSARDVFVFISGGDSPFENNYSQYLQARAVVSCWTRQYPNESIWVFFGAGNVQGESPLFGDVRHKIQKDGLTLDSWVPGFLDQNRPARRDIILAALRDEILPAVAPGATLHLFVGDHGERPRGDDRESLINLWGLERDATTERGWRSLEDATLGVRELRRVLTDGLGKGRVVFCMTQCHAGGFHYLAIPRVMTPNAKWFSKVPRWATVKTRTVFPRVAGFTAADEYSPAAGCDPAPTMEGWAGYERFVPEQLFGIDLFTLESNGSGLNSFAEAHQAATLVDRTIDNPYSTSDQYLERWADLIENQLAENANLTSKVKREIAVYQQSANGSSPRARNRAFRQRQAMFNRFTERLIEQNPAIKDLLRDGTRRELENAIDPDEEEQDQTNQEERDGERRRRRGGGRSETRALWNNTLRPAWAAAVEANQISKLSGAALAFEKHLLHEETDGGDFFFGRGGALAEEVFWNSGYSDPQSLNQAKAEAVACWAAERRATILAWGKDSEEERVRNAAERLSRRTSDRNVSSREDDSAPPKPIAKEIAAERVLFYRRVLAAWQFLLNLREAPALTRLQELIDLEQTPLPK